MDMVCRSHQSLVSRLGGGQADLRACGQLQNVKRNDVALVMLHGFAAAI